MLARTTQLGTTKAQDNDAWIRGQIEEKKRCETRERAPHSGCLGKALDSYDPSRRAPVCTLNSRPSKKASSAGDGNPELVISLLQ
jgi:hypothetical protein